MRKMRSSVRRIGGWTFAHGTIGLAVLLGLVLTPAPGALAQPTILLRQGEFEKTITPVEGSVPVEEFYNYSTVDYSSRTPMGLETPRMSLLFFYRDTTTGKLSLVMIHNAPNAGPGGQVRLRIDGLPSGARLALKDDANDRYAFEPPTAELEWTWTSGHTDGAIIDDLEEPFSLTITPDFGAGIHRWKVLTINDPAVGIERVPLPSRDEPITLLVGRGGPPQAAFHVTPDVPRVNAPVMFDARPSQVLTPNIARYEWDFDGDGVFDVSTEEPIVTHVYEESGTYTVTLRITDANGISTTASRTITVLGREERPPAQTGIRRTISTPQVTPSGVFRVTVELTVQVPSNGLGLEEELPLDWVIEPVRSDGAIFKFVGSRGQWLFPMLLKAGETRRIVYDVFVPSAETLSGGPPLPARLKIRGAVTSVSPEYTLPVGGESEIELVSCLSVPVAVAHLDVARERIDLKLSEIITEEQLNEALTLWKSNVAVPGTCNARIDSEDLQRLLMHRLLAIPVDGALPPPASDAENPVVTATRKVITALPKSRLYPQAEGGNVFQVELEIRAREDLPGLHLREDLPEGWELKPQAFPGFLYKPDTREWVLPGVVPAGQIRLLRYEVVVPQEAPAGRFTIAGVVESGLTTFENPIRGDQSVEVIDCLTIPLAIAHYDVKTGEIDVALDNLITKEQANAAFRMWLEDEEVPGTCGEKLDLLTLQHIIELMVTGTPVEE